MVGAVLALLFVAAPVVAQDETVLIQFDVVARGKVGEVVPIGDVAVDPDLVGTTCVGTIQVQNNESAHPNNDFIISSGGTTVEVPDFERTPGGITTVQSRLVLGETITASIRLGEDKVASLAGDTVVVASNCGPEPTTTLPSPSTTGAVSADTSTTLETPIGGVSAGGGGTATGSDVASAWLMVAGGLSLVSALALATGRTMWRGRGGDR